MFGLTLNRSHSGAASVNRRVVHTFVCGLALAAGLAACSSGPQVRTQSAPELNVLQYRTFGFVEHPDTDRSSYTTLTTRYLKDAVTRAMLARGYTQSQTPDLSVNFRVGTRDKVESSGLGVGYGGWGGRRWGWGAGYGDDVRTVTEGSLTIEVVERAAKQVVWSGTARGRLTDQKLDYPQPAIDAAVDAIFAKYPKQSLVAQNQGGT